MKFDISNARKRIANSLSTELDYTLIEFAEQLEGMCESPIELMLLLAFEGMSLFHRAGCQAMFYVSRGESYEDARSKGIIVIYPQFRWNEYRIDFLAKCRGIDVFIECDGHDFHERTPEQAERDRRKDRVFQDAGIPILRFTGREIHRDPIDVAWQVIRFFSGRASKYSGD